MGIVKEEVEIVSERKGLRSQTGVVEATRIVPVEEEVIVLVVLVGELELEREEEMLVDCLK